MRLKVRELQPLHSPEVSGNRPLLRQLGDADLLLACNNPLRADPLRQNMATGKLVDGNGRAYELKRRAADSASTITWDTEISVEPYYLDDSMFID